MKQNNPEARTDANRADLVITSVQNPKVKALAALQQKSSERRRTGLFVVEGAREVEHCLEAGLTLHTLWVCDELCPQWTNLLRFSPGNNGQNNPSAEASSISKNVNRKANEQGSHSTEATDARNGRPLGATTIHITPAVYEKIAYRGSTEGVLAVVKERRLTLDDLQLPENPLLCVLESVEKPGNLGAVLRTADAAGIDAVVVCDPLTDLYNPNLIRSSIGAAFTVPVVACDSAQCIDFLKRKGISILTAQLQDSHLYYDTDMRRATAIVMGTEATGLTDQWRQAADAHIRIPMLGRLDSLNVSVSAAILLYEAVRQRQTEG